MTELPEDPLSPTHSPRVKATANQRKGTRTRTPGFPTTQPVVAGRMAPGLAWPLLQLVKLLSFLGPQIPHKQHEEVGWRVLNALLAFCKKEQGLWCQAHLVFKGRELER